MHLITMYIPNGHLVLFHCYYICLILLILTLFVVSEKCCHPCVQSVCTLKAGDTHTHTQPIRLESLNRHNVSKQCEAAVQRQRHLQYSTVRSGHRSSSLLHNHSLNTSKNQKKKKKKTGTENVNTTKKGNVIF